MHLPWKPALVKTLRVGWGCSTGFPLIEMWNSKWESEKVVLQVAPGAARGLSLLCPGWPGDLGTSDELCLSFLVPPLREWPAEGSMRAVPARGSPGLWWHPRALSRCIPGWAPWLPPERAQAVGLLLYPVPLSFLFWAHATEGTHWSQHPGPQSHGNTTWSCPHFWSLAVCQGWALLSVISMTFVQVPVF